MGAGAGLGRGAPGGGRARWAQPGQGWSLLGDSLVSLPWVGREPWGSRSGWGTAVPPPSAHRQPPGLWGAGIGKEGWVTLLVILQA